MALGPGDVVGGRYELIRMLGGSAAGRVYVAYDRHLAREVAIRFVEPGDQTAAAALLEEGRRMASVQFDSLQGIPVLDAGEIPGGGAYAVLELVDGIPLEEVARRRGPLAPHEATRHAVELLDACLVVRRHERGRADMVVGSALVGSDGHIRVTHFARAAGPGPDGSDPAVSAVAATLAELLAGGPVPPALGRVIEEARAGSPRTAEELRARLLAAQSVSAPAEESPEPPPPRRWPWVVVGVIAALLIALLVLVFVVGNDDDEGGRVIVPDVAGQTAARASELVADAGLKPVRVGRTSTEVPRGVAISSAPAAGAEVEPGSTVTIDVSRGSGTQSVPALIGLTEARAGEELAGLGLEARIVRQADDGVPEGVVSAQNPGAGVEVAEGATVTVTVSSGPAPVAVPDLVGETVSEASALLRRFGLALGTVSEEPGDGESAGLIVAQDPPAAERVPPGTAVDVIQESPAPTG